MAHRFLASATVAAFAISAGVAPAPTRAQIWDAKLVAAPHAAKSAGYLECVPYARSRTGIEIYGNAHTWWEQAKGRFPRYQSPKVGAVIAFKPHGNMTLGHVAAVSQVIDKRTIFVSHANWSPMDDRRGWIEDNVPVVDVSEWNDWSRVRVWYAPTRSLGTTQWPVQGFIYPAGSKPTRVSSGPQKSPASGYRRLIVDENFLNGIKGEPAPQRLPDRQNLRNDPIGRIIASRTAPKDTSDRPQRYAGLNR